MKSRFPAKLLLQGTVVVFFSTVLYSHPFHITTAEARLNLDQKALEVALELDPLELQQSMEARWNRTIDLDAPGAEALIKRYAEAVFRVSYQGQPMHFQWVGMELDITSGWLYFQFEAVEDLQHLVIENRFLAEAAQLSDGQQLNTIRFEDPSVPEASARKLALTFTAPTYQQTLTPESWRKPQTTPRKL